MESSKSAAKLLSTSMREQMIWQFPIFWSMTTANLMMISVSSNAEDRFNKATKEFGGFLHEILRNQILVGDVYTILVDQEDH